MMVQIGTSSIQPKFMTVSSGKRHSLAIDCLGQVYITGDNSYRQLGIANANELMAFKQLLDFSLPAKQVAAGTEHSLILTQDGRVYASGNNQNGSLGLGHNYSSDKFLSVNGLSGLKFI